MAFQYKEMQDMESIPAPAGTATPRSQHVTEDGKTLVYGTTAPSDAATGYAPGCLFVDTDSGAQYINEGTSASADFNQIVTVENIDSAVSAAEVVTHIDKTESAGTAAGLGPSPLIWDTSKLLAVMLDPTAGFYYFNDYLGEIDVTTADGYVVTQVNSGAIAPVATEDGGVLLVDSAGNNAEDDGVNVQLTNCMFKPVAGRTDRKSVV